MTDFRAKYKQKGLSFGDLERSRITRASERDERRKEIRAETFDKLRPLIQNANPATPGAPAVTSSRIEKLQKWKQEKDMKKKTDKKVEKPPFKVGVVHHRVFSPPINGPPIPSCSHSHSHSSVKSRIQQAIKSPIKRITRVTEKRLAAKAAAKAAQKKSFAPPNYKFRAPAGLPNLPLFGRVKKGSIDATKLSFNLGADKNIPIKSEARNSALSQRKISNLVTHESPRRSKKYKTNPKEDESISENSQDKTEPRISRSSKRRASNSSPDSASLRVSSDDPEVFESPVAESSSFNPNTKKRESAPQELPINQISPANSNKKSPSKLQIIYPVTKISESSSDENNDPVLEMNSSQAEKDSLQVEALPMADEVPEMSAESGFEKMDSSWSEHAAFFSPYVVTRRGKKEARKETKLRQGFNHSIEEIPTKETIMQTLNISIDEEVRTSQYFKCLIESETNRLQEQCDHWTNIVAFENPPEEALYIVQQAVGQTKLLLAKKFKRFESLVLDCEKGDGQMLVTCKDLQGFWDIVNMEIRNCENRFAKLEELRTRGWIEEEEVKQPPIKRLPKKKSPKKKAPAKSSLRAMILAARQKKKELEVNLEAEPADEAVLEIWNDVVKSSPTKVPSANKRKSSTTTLGSSHKEVNKSIPLAVMAISQKCKTPEDKDPEIRASLENEVESEMETEDKNPEIVNFQVQLDDSITYINSRQTPGKSILKRIKVEITSDGSDDARLIKSTQKVIFNDNVQLKEVEPDEEEKTKASLAAALARIDSAEFDSEFVSEMEIRAERKLNFEDESFNENLNASKENSIFDDEEPVYQTFVIPEFKIIPPTPKSPRLNKRKQKKGLEKSILEESILEEEASAEEQNSQHEETFTRSLRNRTIVGNLTPKSEKKLKSNPDKSLDLSGSLNQSSRSLRKTPKSPGVAGKSPRNKKENSLLEDDKYLDLSESLNQSSRSSKKTGKSPRLAGKSPRQKSNRKIPSPSRDNQDKSDEKPTEKSSDEQKSSVSTPKSTRRSSGRSLQKKEENGSSEKQGSSGNQSDNESPVARFVKKAARKTSLLYNMMKSPRSSSKKTKEISQEIGKVLEAMQIDSESESKKSDSPAKPARRSLLRRSKKSEDSFKQENETEVEDEISKEKMQVKENRNSEGKSALGKLDISASNADTSKLNGIQVNGDETRENSNSENLTDLLEAQKNPVKITNSRKHRSTGNILNPADVNYKDSNELNQSLKESKLTKSRRSELIPLNDLPVEKENETPKEVLKRIKREYSMNPASPKVSPRRSPKPNETPNKRKSIKRSMSCHMEECSLAAGAQSNHKRNKSSGLVKTPTIRRTVNLMSFESP
ncbi:uncharacterized protein LOC117174213 isoform X2 [Belonocnema kinseyi]|uniref:uncharacterized protein LOC117174213 isoform X2 n=1 Tax=Belonocnema kinseyi TaxID=2817044 RepID=UPI00143CCE6C|nr:uncharacterized protein LOC117174213 isoform X2 [Belonocnema kinseyi]